MWRLIFIISILPIVAAIVARWYFGLRVLSKDGRQPCTVDPIRWQVYLGDKPALETPSAPAVELGKVLRLAALEDWKTREPKKAASRESARKFGLAVPPLALVIAVFALLVAKIPFLGAVAILFASTALSAAFGLLSLGGELRAIAVTTRKLRESRSFMRRDDEEAVASCAVAHAWSESIPPILRVF
ncbi:hypothetical protein OVA24_13490 [Luteolibacter sp. SL250]|uniref:hypothetical protein n=1 Tax=Luteolibacter sp. SL250 TaxID=2995170 RepID=UPI00226E72F4|nr:hypothetical protein [Luteolibacter sp. SL250]WAC18250.1 hypothetical protein OVA24_13490 [Luteolibacter sp. SL250]